MNNYKLAVVGATGVVGQTVLKVLEEKKLPIKEYTFFASKRSAGKTLKFMDDVYLIKELTEESLKNGNFDFAIFSAGGDTALKYAPIAASSGCIVIDNSSAFRMDNMVPLVVPEVNSEEIAKNTGIIANPNCSTIQAVVALKPLDDMFGIKRIIYSTYQAVSGAGSKGIHDLENGIYNFEKDSKNDNSKNNHNYKLEKFPYPIFNNCLPHIDNFLENGYTKEEEKMINETRKILNRPDLPITATTVRVPVFNCHCESINVEFNNGFELEDVVKVLKNSPGIIVQDEFGGNEKNYALPSLVSGCDNVFVGRIRRDFSVRNGVNLWVVADNIRKGAASNAVQILEKLI